MQKINLRELYPDVYKTDVFVDVAEEVLAAIRGQEQDDAAYERRMYRHKAHYSLNQGDGIENDALNRPLTPEEILEQKQLHKSKNKPNKPSDPAPINGEKKKIVAGQAASCAQNGFSRTAAVLSTSRPPFLMPSTKE